MLIGAKKIFDKSQQQFLIKILYKIEGNPSYNGLFTKAQQKRA